MRVVKETDVKKVSSFVIKVDMEHAGMETVKLLFDDIVLPQSAYMIEASSPATFL